MIVRVYLPTGSHLMFGGVEKVVSPHPDYISFGYTEREGVKRKGHAVFGAKQICGYAKEGPDDSGTAGDRDS